MVQTRFPKHHRKSDNNALHASSGGQSTLHKFSRSGTT
jgi:hypothetical protein